MADEKGSPEGQQPEALASLEAAARSGSKKPDDQGLTAQSDTAPAPDSLEDEQKRAADQLRAAAEGATGAPASGPPQT